MLKTFSIGGVHPHENKLSAHQPIVTAEVPAKAVILLGQHIGAPAKPIVAKGDVVKVGTKIAEANGFVSAAIHSSVSGKVAKIDSIVDASGYAKPAIFIDVDGDEWEESIDRSPELVKECELTSEEIVKKIADAGIVGLGGACFPTQVKLCPPPSFKAECVIINAVECEPYLTADHQLMLEHAEEVMVGVAILMKAVKVNKAFIGIENNKPDAIQLMTKVASSYAGIEVVPLKVKYPQGGDFLNYFQFTSVVIKLSLNVCKSVDTRDDLCSVFAQTVQDTTQRFFTYFVCFCSDFDSTFGSSE